MENLTFLLRGFIIGFSIAAPVGPIGILCIQRTLRYGRMTGFISGLGAATADAIYGMVAGLGLTAISGLLLSQGSLLRLAGGVFLCYLGIRTFLERPASGGQAAAEGSANLPLKNAYATTVALTLTNPMTILSFTAIFAGLGLAAGGSTWASALALVLGVFFGSATWWLTLSFVSGLFRQKLGTPGGLRWINRISGAVILGFGIASLASLLWQPQAENQPQSQLLAPAPASASAGFSRADAPRQFQFPQDHGPHEDFQTEWWYFTGTLQNDAGQKFGFQLTFFRRALLPSGSAAPRSSDWAASQVYLAHFALTDAGRNEHLASERFSRGAAGLAGAHSPPFRVWLEDWQAVQTAPGVFHLNASSGEAGSDTGIAVDLELTQEKEPVLQGEAGLSRKGPQPGQASYYYSLTGLRTAGTLRSAGITHTVQGSAWMDHEFSTSALGPDQVGWDWFSIQMEDGSQLMLFELRQTDGSIDPFSSGTLVLPDGKTIPLKAGEFSVTVLDRWTSPHTGAIYPAGWQIEIPSRQLSLKIQPLIADQEMVLSYAYWEGAVQVQARSRGSESSGSGYVELTGYAGSMRGQF
jgi:predicted secreted hydrolase/threonine/homoserine/homoserine lactone efflux protein